MKDNYTYPIILDYDEENMVNINIPDFENAFTCMGVDEDYISEAQDLLALMIIDFEEKGKDIPVPTLNIRLGERERLVYVNVWMPYHRSKTKEVFVKKTLTIPSWLDILAKNQNINFSSILVKGLKKELL